MSEEMELLGIRITATEKWPPTEAWLVNPRLNPITGELDIEATRKASVRVTNLANPASERHP